MTHAIIAVGNHLSSPLSALIDWIKSVKKSWDEDAAVRQTIKELSKLSDRELNDIGIARGDIYSVARGDDTLIRASENSNLKGWV